LEQDYDTWEKYWIQKPEQVIVASNRNHSFTHVGWESLDKGVKAEFSSDAVPDIEINKTNFDIHMNGKYAFVMFDVIQKQTTGNRTQIDSLKTYAVMIKQDNIWKYISMHLVAEKNYDPTLINVIHSLNWASWVLGNELQDNDAALKILNISEELDPDYEKTHQISAVLYENIKNNESALMHWEKVLNSDPNNEMAKERIEALRE